MNSAMSWSVKGIEPEVREAAKVAARKSGKTLGQWLNTMILETAGEDAGTEREYTPPAMAAGRRSATSPEERLEQLEHELARLSRAQTDTALPPRSGFAAGPEPEASPLQHILERLEVNERETVRAFESLHERIGRLSEEVSETRTEVAEREPADATLAEQDAFETALRNVVDHIERADEDNRDILADLNARLEDLTKEVSATPKSADSANRKILADVERRLTALAHRVDQIGQQDNSDLKDSFENRIAQLTGQIEKLALAPSDDLAEDMDERLSELARRIDVAEQSANRSRAELSSSLEDRLGQLTDRLEAVRDSSRQTAEDVANAAVRSAQDELRNIEAQVRQLAEQFQSSAGVNPETQEAINDVMQQMSHLSHDVRQIRVEAASEADLRSVRSGLDNLSDMMQQHFASATQDDAFSALEQRLSDVSERLEDTLTRADPQVENLERRIHEIDARLAASQGDTQTEELVNALGAQIDTLTQRVGQSEQQHSSIQAIEKSISQLFESIDQTRSFAAEAAEKAAGRVAEQVLAGGDKDSAHFKALEQGLQALKASAESADQRNQETLVAVHDTLEKVIIRLVALEEGLGDDPMSDPASPDTMQLGAVPGAGLDDLKLPPIPPMPSPHGLLLEEESADYPDIDDGSAEQTEGLLSGNEPALPPLDEETDGVQCTPCGPDDAAAPGDSASRRNDFIAAARQAAKVVAEAPEENKGFGPFKMLKRGRGDKKSDKGSSGSKRRRPLILAAIVLLMIGAASAYKIVGSKRSGVVPAQVTAPPPAKVTSPNEAAPPAAETPESKDTPGAEEPQKQSRVMTPEAERSVYTPRPHATEVTKTEQPLKVAETPAARAPMPGPGKEALDVPVPGTKPGPDKADALTTGSIDPAGDTRALQDTSQSDPFTLVMPNAQGPGAFALMPEPTGETEKSDPAPKPLAKVAQPRTPVARDLPPAGVGPIGMRIAAANGDPVAQFMVANALTEGKTIKQDFRLAAQWYQKSAARGLAPAQYRLATFYEKGKGVPEDVAAARIWYKRAAEKGNRKAMHNLAVIHADGSRGSPDFAQAAVWFRKAADLGLKDSQYNLAILYERGLGVAKDLSRAYKWFALAAKQGDRDADTRLRQIASRMAPQALIQAKLEVENWTAESADEAANLVNPPPGQWQEARTDLHTGSLATTTMISEAQSLLNRLGYSAGPADGLIGTRTRDAIRSFQRANNLAETGAVTDRLLDALRQRTG